MLRFIIATALVIGTFGCQQYVDPPVASDEQNDDGSWAPAPGTGSNGTVDESDTGDVDNGTGEQEYTCYPDHDGDGYGQDDWPTVFDGPCDEQDADGHAWSDQGGDYCDDVAGAWEQADCDADQDTDTGDDDCASGEPTLVSWIPDSDFFIESDAEMWVNGVCWAGDACDKTTALHTSGLHAELCLVHGSTVHVNGMFAAEDGSHWLCENLNGTLTSHGTWYVDGDEAATTLFTDSTGVGCYLPIH